MLILPFLPSSPIPPPPPSLDIMATSPSQVLLISPVALADTVDMHSKLNSRLINKAEAVCPTGRYFFICLQPSPADDRPPVLHQRHSRARFLTLKVFNNTSIFFKKKKEKKKVIIIILGLAFNFRKYLILYIPVERDKSINRTWPLLETS